MLQLTDPADAARAFAEVNFDWVKLGTGRFFVKRVVIDLDGCLLAYHHVAPWPVAEPNRRSPSGRPGFFSLGDGDGGRSGDYARHVGDGQGGSCYRTRPQTSALTLDTL